MDPNLPPSNPVPPQAPPVPTPPVTQSMPPAPPPVMPPPPPNPESFNFKRVGLMLFAGLIFLLVVFGGGAYFFGTKQYTEPQVRRIQQPVKISPTPTASSSATTIDTSAWKTYANSKYNFSIKYPSGWKFGQDETGVNIYFDTIETFGSGPEPIKYSVFIVIHNNPQKLPIKEYLKQSTGVTYPFEVTKEIIGEYTTYKTTQLPSQFPTIDHFFTKDETQYVQVSLSPYDLENPQPQQDKYKQIYDQIVSTFKFNQ